VKSRTGTKIAATFAAPHTSWVAARGASRGSIRRIRVDSAATKGAVTTAPNSISTRPARIGFAWSV
jgi:hypothetical protein